MNIKLTKEELFKKAQERFSSWAKMYSNPEVTAQQMYEDMSCSCYSAGKPVLDQNLSFEYKGYMFELSSCNNITNKEQILGLTTENIRERFPKGIFSDKCVCWMLGNKDEVYLVPDAWSWGADDQLKPGAEVNRFILEGVDKFLETFKE